MLRSTEENPPMMSSCQRGEHEMSRAGMYGSGGERWGEMRTMGYESVGVWFTLRALQWCSSSIGISDQSTKHLCTPAKITYHFGAAASLSVHSSGGNMKENLLVNGVAFKDGVKMRSKYTDTPKSGPTGLQVNIMQDCVLVIILSVGQMWGTYWKTRRQHSL